MKSVVRVCNRATCTQHDNSTTEEKVYMCSRSGPFSDSSTCWWKIIKWAQHWKDKLKLIPLYRPNHVSLPKQSVVSVVTIFLDQSVHCWCLFVYTTLVFKKHFLVFFVESPNSNQYILTIQYLWQLQAYDNPNQSSHSGLKLLGIVKAISKLITSNCRASVVKMFAMFLSMVIVKRVGFLTCEWDMS